MAQDTATSDGFDWLAEFACNCGRTMCLAIGLREAVYPCDCGREWEAKWQPNECRMVVRELTCVDVDVSATVVVGSE